jgi:GDP-L-fucose synthase
MFNHKRVLITGSAGLVGKSLAARLYKSGAIVRAVCRKSAPPDFCNEIYSGDLTERPFCDEVVKDVDYVFHCAANTSGAAVMGKTPLVHVTPNIIMNANLMEAAYFEGVKKFVWLASTTGYPECDDAITEDRGFEGDPYEKYFAVGWMKRYTEVLCKLYSEKLDPRMPCVVLRPTNIYGPGDKFDLKLCHVLPALVRKVADRHTPIEVWGDGSETRDLIYVEDMVTAILLAAEKLNGYDPLNIGSGTSTSVTDLLDSIIRLDNFKDAVVEYIDGPRMIPKRAVSVEKAKSLIEFEASTSLDEGLLKTIEWYRNS